jgi:hypothetical protein
MFHNQKSSILPVGAVQWHVSLDNTVDSDPLVLCAISIKRNARVPANKALATVCADQVFTLGSISALQF